MRYADSHPKIIVRVFAPFADAETAAREVEAWGANAILGVLEASDLKAFLQSLPDSIITSAWAEAARLDTSSEIRACLAQLIAASEAGH